VEKLDQAISVIESLNGAGASRKTNRPARIVPAVSRRKMVQGGAMGKRAEWIAASSGENNCFGTSAAHYVGIGP
jgi:hypothetical protein